MRWLLVLPVGLIVFALAVVSLPRLSAQPVAANPPGNNGTIKLDGIPFDDHPDNEPHVGCLFQLDFYGFDAGDLFADVQFDSIPPTGNGQLLTDRVFIGEDDNSGGGSEAGLDAARTYDLTTALSGVLAHPQQGFHIKVTVHADGSQGADTKYKVFWVDRCPPGPPAVIPEFPLPLALPLSTAALASLAWVLRHRREQRARAPTVERRADY